CLRRGRNSDRHAEDRECDGRIWTHPAREHMVPPHQKAEKPDGKRGHHHNFVSEYGFARESRDDFRDQPHSRKDGDVNLRVSEEPKKVLPEQRRTPAMSHDAIAYDETARHKETCARVAVQQQKHSRGKQYGKPEKT